MQDAPDITLGEVYRLLQAVDARVLAIQNDTRAESHSVRNKIAAHETAIALLNVNVATLQAMRRDWRTWGSSGVVGCVVVAVDYVLHRWK